MNPSELKSPLRRGNKALILALRSLLVLVSAASIWTAFVLGRRWSRNAGRPPNYLDAFEQDVRMSALLIFSAVVLTVVCFLAFDRGKSRLFGAAGIAAALTGMVLGLIEVWDWWAWGYTVEGEHLLTIIWIWAVLCTVLSLASLARLSGRLVWLNLLAQLLLTVVGVLLTDTIWARATNIAPAFPPTAVDIVGILAAGAVMAIFILHQLFWIKRFDGFDIEPLPIELDCPRCGSRQIAEVGKIHCARCDLQMKIEVGDAACDSCGYPLYKLPGRRCPECGQPFSKRLTTPSNQTTSTVDQTTNATDQPNN